MVACALCHGGDVGAVRLAQLEVDGVGGLGQLRHLLGLVWAHPPHAHVAAQRLYEGMGFRRLHEREYQFERPDGSSFLMLAYGRDADARERRVA